MTIPRLQGWFDEIQPYVKSIGETLDNKFNYTRKLQLAMQQEVAKNPALLQQFADLRARDPNVLKKMGLDNIDFMIGGLPESAGSKKDTMQAEVFKTPLTPEESTEFRAGTLGTKTSTERAQEQVNLERSFISKDMEWANSMLQKILFPEKIAEGQAAGAKAKADIVSSEQALQLLQQYPLAKKARDTIGNDYEKALTLPPEQYDALTNHPMTKEPFEKLRDDYWRRWNAEWQRKYRREGRAESLLDTWATQVALYGRTTPTAALQFASLPPDDQKRLLESSTAPSPEEEALWRAGQGMNTLGTKNEISVQKTISDFIFKDAGFIQATKVISGKGTTPEQKKNAMNTANAIIQAKANELGMPNPPQFEYKQSGAMFWKKFEPTLVSGDLTLAREIGAKIGLTINTPGEASVKADDERIASNSAAMDGAAAIAKREIDALKTQAEKDAYIASLATKFGPAQAAEIRKRLAKFQ